MLMIDVLNNCKHNAKCLNFYLYKVSCRPKVSGTPGEFWFVCQWRCWNFCLTEIRSKVISLVHFSRRVAHGKKKLSAHLLLSVDWPYLVTAGIWATSLAPFSNQNARNPIYLVQFLIIAFICQMWICNVGSYVLFNVESESVPVNLY